MNFQDYCHQSEYKYWDRVPIKLLGCWDTVGSLGLPDALPHLPIDKLINRDRYKFHDTTLSPIIKNAMHAVASDETRKAFAVTLMEKSPEAFVNASWHRENWMAIEFSMVYRWHSALPETFTYNGESTPMASSLWNNQMLIDMGLGALMEETCSQPGTRIGLFNTPDFPVKKTDEGIVTFIDVTELATIQYGRMAQLASYNDYRQMCGFPRVTDFNQITGDEYAQQKLKELYGDVDKIEFFVGLYAEDVRQNSAIPPLVARVIGIDAFSQALTNPLLSDKIFKPETFSDVGWKIIQNTKTVSDLVNRNVTQGDRPYKVTFNNK